MQLFALDTDQRITFAGHAVKQCDYFCLECKGVVRIRGGSHRQIHFYHLSHGLTCRLSGKSLTHLQLQLYLQAFLPAEEVQLEHRFEAINRIADVVWNTQKIVFEIQCSAITAEEVQKRNRDYWSQGFRVVWILHDKRFNQWRMTAAEQFLQGSTYYYTNMDAEGCGIIYDQFDVVLHGIRKATLPRVKVDLVNPKWLSGIVGEEGVYPQKLRMRLQQWPLHFSGDLVDLFLAGNEAEYFDNALQLEAEHIPVAKELSWKETVLLFVYKFVVRPYRLALQMLLERACK